MITYPVRASGDGTDRIIDAEGRVLGTVEIVALINAARADPAAPSCRAPAQIDGTRM